MTSERTRASIVKDWPDEVLVEQYIRSCAEYDSSVVFRSWAPVEYAELERRWLLLETMECFEVSP
jgi:hypothetical protein